VTEALEKEMGKVAERQRTGEFYNKARIALTNKTRTSQESA
jgi:hypothetical protein